MKKNLILLIMCFSSHSLICMNKSAKITPMPSEDAIISNRSVTSINLVLSVIDPLEGLSDQAQLDRLKRNLNQTRRSLKGIPKNDQSLQAQAKRIDLNLQKFQTKEKIYKLQIKMQENNATDVCC